MEGLAAFVAGVILAVAFGRIILAPIRFIIGVIMEIVETSGAFTLLLLIVGIAIPIIMMPLMRAGCTAILPEISDKIQSLRGY